MIKFAKNKSNTLLDALFLIWGRDFLQFLSYCHTCFYYCNLSISVMQFHDWNCCGITHYVSRDLFTSITASYHKPFPRWKALAMAQTPVTNQFKDLGGCTMGFQGCMTGFFSPALNLCFLLCLVRKLYLVTNCIIVFIGHLDFSSQT